MTTPLPALVDKAQLMDELGVKRAVADAIFRELPPVTFPGVRKVFVRRADVLALVEAGTWVDDGTSLQRAS